MLTRDDLDHLREGWAFEAKAAGGRDGSGAVPASFWDTYSAMANADGGYVALGVRERSDGALEVQGVPDADRLERELFDQLNDRDKVSANVIRRPDVLRMRDGDRNVVVIHVPRASRSERPVYLGRDPFSQAKHAGTYVRVHEGDRHVPPERVRRMFADAQTEHPVDATILDAFGLPDFDTESVAAYRNLFASRRPDHPFLREDTLGFLRCIRAWGKDRERGAEGPTVAGLLMLGRETAIRDQFPHFHLSYREEDPARAPGGRWADRIAPDGTWNANLLEFYLRVIRKLHRDLEVPFRLDPELFRRDETAVHEALREALVNTLIHADYAGRSGVRIIRRPGGFEMLNPGTLLVPVEQVWRGGVSEARNPTLHFLFGQLQLGEREGSGGPKIRDAWRAQHWRAPSLSDDAALGQTRLVLPNESLLPGEALAEVERRFPEHFAELDEAGRVMLVTAFAEGTATHARLVEATGLHPRDVTLRLAKLQKWGVLERTDSGRGSPYRTARRGGFEPCGSDTDHLGSGTDHLGAGSDHLRPGSDHLSPSSDHLSSGSDHLPMPDLEGDWTASAEVVRVRRSGKATRERVERAVLAACADAFRTLQELADALGRSAHTLRVHYLQSMVERRLLDLRHPGSPRHPHQAYRAAQAVTRDDGRTGNGPADGEGER